MKKKIFSIKYLAYDFIKLTAGIPGLIYHRPKIMYESKAARKKQWGGAIAIANHLGFFDPIYVQYALWYRRHRFICLKKFFESKAGRLFKLFMCIPIDKENFNITSFHTVIDCLEADWLVSMFPEGRVNDGSGEMAVFKSGVIVMALKSKKPIIPIYVQGKKHWYDRIKIMIGEPISLENQRMSFSLVDKTAADLKDKEEYLKKLIEKSEGKK